MSELPVMGASRRLRALRSMDPTDAIEHARALEGVPEIRLILELEQAGENEDDINELKNHLKFLREEYHYLTSTQMAETLRASHDATFPAIETQSPDAEPGDRSPQWPTSIPEMDELTGGGYGMTVYAGEPKVGKSMLALASAIESARRGWRVLYVNAEMSPDEIARRIARYCGAEAELNPEDLKEQLMILNVNVGITLEVALREFIDKIHFGDVRLLIVIDSINRIVDMGLTDVGDDASYWGAMRKWTNFCMQARRHSEGIISWLIVSELNRRMQVKGQNLEYTADLVVSLANDEHNQNQVDINVMLSRSTPTGTLGTFVRHWDTCRFNKD